MYIYNIYIEREKKVLILRTETKFFNTLYLFIYNYKDYIIINVIKRKREKERKNQ